MRFIGSFGTSVLPNRGKTRQLFYAILCLLIAIATLYPLLSARLAGAAQITTRSLAISTAVPGATSVSYTFGDGTNGFEFGSSHVVRAMKFEACTTPVGTCTIPTGFTFAGAGGYNLTNWQDATAFTRDNTNQNDCDGTQSARIVCISRGSASVAENTTANHQIVITGVTNPTTANSTLFIRMYSYTNATYTLGTLTDSGTVAAAVVQTLTVSADVAEVLQFCIGATTVDDDTSPVGANCAAVSGTTVDIGVLDTSQTNVSPVDTTDAGNDMNGIAMIRTNAFSGATIDYEAIQQTGTEQLGTLRINGATCDPSPATLTDRCIQAQGTTQATFTPGASERFGMTIAAINPSSTTSYVCTFAGGDCNLTRDAEYDGNGTLTYTTDTGLVPGTTEQGYAWDASGASDRIASSTTVVDDEALILKFAAYPAIVTPFGSYSAQADFIAIATY